MAAPNPTGKGLQKGRPNTQGQRVTSRIHQAIGKALDMLGLDSVDGKGSTELGRMINEKLKADPIGTLKALAPLLPKEVSLDVVRRTETAHLTDDELSDLVAQRARDRREKDVQGEVLDQVVNDS